MIRIAYLWIVLGVFVGQVSGFDLIPFREGDLWGYADPFGFIVYVPEYKFAGVFRNGIARVQTKEEYGYIAMNGRTFFSSNLESACDFSDGMAAVKIKGTGKWGFINSMFSIAVPPTYQEVGDFSENVAPVQLNGKWGVIDKQGKVLVPFKYDEIKPCRENAMAVCSAGKWGFIRPSGELLLDFQYRKAHSFSEGVAGVSPDGKYYIYIDVRGEQVVPGEYQWAGRFRDGVASIKKNDAFGAIDKTGKVIIPPAYAYLSDFSDGLAVCAVNFRYGYINARGELVIPLNYTDALPFENGIARVWERKKTTQTRINGSMAIQEIPVGGGYIDLRNKKFYRESKNKH